MKQDGKVYRLGECLQQANIAPDQIAFIMQGGDEILSSNPPARKAEWLRNAMIRMDQVLDPETRHTIRQACACCLGGKRLDISKAIAKKGGTLEERIAAANEARLVFGHSVTLEENGQIIVRFAPDDADQRCSCLPMPTERMPVTYCYCCAGHVKHHLQIALGRELKVQVRSSVLSSGGAKPCSFRFTLLQP